MFAMQCMLGTCAILFNVKLFGKMGERLKSVTISYTTQLSMKLPNSN